ncbi:MAG: cobalamin-binding protein [Planctomycetota bacterium]
MRERLTKADRFGLVRPPLDAHTLGMNHLQQLLEECGYACVVADGETCKAAATPESLRSATLVERWIRENHVTVLGFSYRLDPRDAAALFGRFVHLLHERRLLAREGGPIRAVYFAGLPEACERVKAQCPEVAGLFGGDETPAETLSLLGVSAGALSPELAASLRYDEDRLAFGKELVGRGGHLAVRPVDRSGYAEFGTRADTVVARLEHGRRNGLPPLMRAHVGPYDVDRKAAVELFLKWTRELASNGFLDVLSIGTSQLTQAAFGEDWSGRPNGGGVPLASAAEFAAVWQAARPMLVRTYAGTTKTPALARLYEETINIAWHALSLWWFCRIDGRGPLDVRENLAQHIETLRFIASSGKPFEANVPHHFAFRGADDLTCVVSAIVAARVAKSLGIRHFILQNMLNTPRSTWGIQDLAKSRALLRLARELEDESFRVILQPRGGLDYFSRDLDRAKAQLAAVTALMDDIEPGDPASPPIVHVVSYCEAVHLADPAAVNESIQITQHALQSWRRLREKGEIDDMTQHREVAACETELVTEARRLLSGIESLIAQPYTAEGLHDILASGFFPVPELSACRDELRSAVAWRTRLLRGGVKVVDDQGHPLGVAQRLRIVADRRERDSRGAPEKGGVR